MAAIIPFIGAGLSMYGSLEQGAQQAAGYRASAESKRAQAAQVDIAADREVQLTEERYRRVRGAQAMAFGRSGVQLGTGSPLAIMERDAANAFSEIRAIRQAQSYRRQSLLTEGLYDERLAGQVEDAAMFNGLSGAFGAIGNNPYLMDSGKKSKNTYSKSRDNIAYGA